MKSTRGILIQIFFFGISFALYGQGNPSSFSANLLQQALSETLKEQPATPVPSPTVKVPTAPSLPQEDKTKKTPPSSSHTKVLEKSVGTIIIDGNKKFEGTLHFSPFSLHVQSTYQGKEFLKNLQSSQIASLTCIQWSAFPYGQKLETFQFICTLYNVRDKEGNNYVYKKVIPALSQITFQNDKGTTLFYFYFVDYIKKNSWENLALPSKQTTVSRPLQGVIRSISFDGEHPLPPIPLTPPIEYTTEQNPIIPTDKQAAKTLPVETPAPKQKAPPKKIQKPKTAAPKSEPKKKPKKSSKTPPKKLVKPQPKKENEVPPAAKDLPEEKPVPNTTEQLQHEKTQIRSRR